MTENTENTESTESTESTETKNPAFEINQELQSRRVNNEDRLIKYVRTMLGEPLINVDVSDEQIRYIIDDSIRHFSDFAFGGESKMAFVIHGEPSIQDYILDPRIQSIYSVSFGGSLGSYLQNSGSGISLGSFGTVGIGYVPYITMQGEVSSLISAGGVGFNAGVGGGVAGGPASSGSGLGRVADAYVIRSQIDAMNALNARAVNFEFNANTKILRIFEDIDGDFLVEAVLEYVPNPEYDEIYTHPWIKSYVLAKTKFLWGTVTGKFSQPLLGGAEINYNDMKNEAQTEIERLEEDLLDKYSEALGIFSG